MSDAKLKKWIKQFTGTELKPHGFSLPKPRKPERLLDFLRQGLEFQPGTGHLAGKFTVNVYWSYMLSPIQDEYSMHAVKRIGHFVDGSNAWYINDDESQFLIVKDIILDLVIPYFDKFSSIQKILHAVDSGESKAESVFPTDIGWREFYLGYCHLQVGDIDRAKYHLEKLVNEHSTPEYAGLAKLAAWMAERSDAAKATLAKLPP